MRSWSPTLVLLGDAVQADPHARGVADLVVPEVGGVPARHRALLDAVLEAAVLGRLQEGHEAPLEVLEVLVHVERDVAAHEPAHRLHPEGDRGVHDLHHPVVLDPAQPLVARPACCRSSRGRRSSSPAALSADSMRRTRPASSGLQHVQVVGHRVEHGLRRHVGQLLGQGGGELEAVHAEVAPEPDPVLDGEVGILAALLARRQLLERRREDADICMYSGLNSLLMSAPSH